MRYCSLKYTGSDNLGDEIQSLATEQYLPRLDGLLDRDKELHAVTEPTFIILNGWFKHGPKHWRENASHCWPPSKLVHPAFFGFHIAFEDLLADEFLEYYRKWAPIGCRDKGTMQMLEQRGVDAYFSRCLTLTFPKRAQTPVDGAVYIVEGRDRIPDGLIPKDLSAGAVYKNHYVTKNYMKKTEHKREAAKALLCEYQLHARLVITNLLHCTMPCLAMRIPVVFIAPPDGPSDYRLDPVRDILPINTEKDNIDWDPKPPDISAIADEITAKVAGVVI
jgi:Polysaccharide pyruvyl transferase